jgi:hypothetical protein
VESEGGGTCPTGECTDRNNGQGIYIAKGSSYCIPSDVTTSFFCPESFAEGGDLTGEYVPATGFSDKRSYRTFTPQVTYMGTIVEVRSIKLGPNGIGVRVLDGLNELSVSQGDLAGLRFEFNSLEFHFSLKINPSQTAENGIPLYEVVYALGSGAPEAGAWENYCDDGSAAAFLPSRRVDGASALVTPGDVTMACRTGVIASCMVWGYKPWEASVSEQYRADYLYGSCLQAKRAAYFAQSGDYTSYTVADTAIKVQDQAGIQGLDCLVPGIEAVWSPTGAVCFSPAYRRIPKFGSLPPLPNDNSLPECGALFEYIHEAAAAGHVSGVLGLDPTNPWLTTSPIPPT